MNLISMLLVFISIYNEALYILLYLVDIFSNPGLAIFIMGPGHDFKLPRVRRNWFNTLPRW